MSVRAIQSKLAELGNTDIAAHAQRFFKTGPGEYGEGDIFRGIRVPVLRRIAAKHRTLALADTLRLLQSRYHEDRFVALCILIHAYERGNEDQKKVIYQTYLSHARWVNNWDLVDASAHKIVGPYLFERDRSVLFTLAGSDELWERRIAIMATLHFIRKQDYGDTLRIAERLLSDPHPLIHKAMGWMLREVGKRDFAVQDAFMRAHYQKMPRTMLRYAIERYPEMLRQAYMKGTIA